MIKNVFNYLFSFLINALFFFIICVYLPHAELGSEVYIIVVTIYGYMLSKINSMIMMFKNKIYLIFSYLSLIVYIFIGIYLKKYIFLIELVDFNTIFIISLLFLAPIIHYFGVVDKYIDKKDGHD